MRYSDQGGGAADTFLGCISILFELLKYKTNKLKVKRTKANHSPAFGVLTDMVYASLTWPQPIFSTNLQLLLFTCQELCQKSGRNGGGGDPSGPHPVWYLKGESEPKIGTTKLQLVFMLK